MLSKFSPLLSLSICRFTHHVVFTCLVNLFRPGLFLFTIIDVKCISLKPVFQMHCFYCLDSKNKVLTLFSKVLTLIFCCGNLHLGAMSLYSKVLRYIYIGKLIIWVRPCLTNLLEFLSLTLVGMYVSPCRVCCWSQQNWWTLNYVSLIAS